jgi:hypothetical protein
MIIVVVLVMLSATCCVEFLATILYIDEISLPIFFIVETVDEVMDY